MKTTRILTSACAVIFLMSAGIASTQAKDRSKLEAKAKITKEQAEKIAIEKAPNGKIKEAELEEEKGKLIWSFDITTPGSSDVTEVNVDAITGAVVAVEHENAKAEAREAREEKKKQ